MSLLIELKRRNVIRVAIAYLALAWLVTEVAGTLFPAFGIPDWGIRFLVIVFALGFVPALIISWAYEITPEGLKREKDVLREVSTTHLTAKRLDLFTIGLIVAAVAFILADRMWLSPRHTEHLAAPAEVVTGSVQTSEAEPQYPPNSIAVLPFVNMSDDAANEYFSDGISEELLNLLAKIPELRVIARTSSFSFKGKDVTIADIARELKVAHVLEGSVRKAGNRARVTAQLIETGSETHLWSETYDRTLEDIFAIQDEIASDVARSLKITLLGEAVPRVHETDPEAYVLYLQCRNFTAGELEEVLKGEQYCRQSLDIDPDYAPSWEALATIYTNMAINGHVTFKDGYEQAMEFQRRALELDPNLASAYSALGWNAMMYDRDLQTAATHFRAALKLAPNDPRILGRVSVFAETLGRFERAIEFADQALAIDPLAATTYNNIATVHCYAGQFEMANERFDKALELNPQETGKPWRAKCYLLQGQPDKALAEAARIELEPRRLWILPMAYYDLGQRAASDRALNEMIEKYPDVAASFIAENFAWRGEIDPAFEWLNRAIEEKQYVWGSLVFDPAFSKLHDDPRWENIRARDGRSEEQLQKINF